MKSHTNVRAYTDSQLLDRVKSLPSFKGIPSGRWILGVRSNEDDPNIYDDKFYEYEGEKFIRVLTGTTNPGIKILKGGFKSFNSKGAAVLKSNEWYYDVWKFGMHRGKIPALRQRGAEMLVYRDGDMDGKSEQLGNPTEGWYGINYHMNTYKMDEDSLEQDIWTIGAWSAGCQVPNDRKQYMERMEWYEEAYISGKQKYVSYCLLDEFDI